MSNKTFFKQIGGAHYKTVCRCNPLSSSIKIKYHLQRATQSSIYVGTQDLKDKKQDLVKSNSLHRDDNRKLQ
jgi:hypothetical protein